MSRKFEFSKVKEPKPGAGYGKYYSWQLREFGREFFKYAVQAHPDDLPDDDWGPGNLEGTDT